MLGKAERGDEMTEKRPTPRKSIAAAIQSGNQIQLRQAIERWLRPATGDVLSESQKNGNEKKLSH
jgi:hypothetical protein